jgi:hypothetical protein
MQGLLREHLDYVGASDLADMRAPSLAMPITMYSDKNPSIALRFENGKAQILYGLRDPNFSPARIFYDKNGNPEYVRLYNSDRSGHADYRPDSEIVEAVLNAAKGQPVGRGYAVAALARAAHAPDENGGFDWGVGLIEREQNMDTEKLPATHSAVAAIHSKWQDAFLPRFG